MTRHEPLDAEPLEQSIEEQRGGIGIAWEQVSDVGEIRLQGGAAANAELDDVEWASIARRSCALRVRSSDHWVSPIFRFAGGITGGVGRKVPARVRRVG